MTEDKTEYVFYTADPQNNTVYLTSEKWDLLTEKHPELHGEESEIKKTVENPDTIYKDKDFEHTFCYYRAHNNTILRTYGLNVKVVVDRESQGAIKTTYFTDRSKEKDGLVYSKPSVPKKND
ncbi:MAG: hypothetical protein D8M26_11070 [Ignavibacteriae bacterium]|nr:hypothetical protein [Ignavibacteriota bacterium]